MKKIIFSCLFALFVFNAFATHIIGGEVRYEYIGPGSTPGSKQYRIRLLLLKGSSAVGAALQSQYILGVFNNDDGSKIPGTAANSNWAANEDFAGVLPVPVIVSPCIQNPPNLGYTYKRYSFVIELKDNNSGYTVTFQTYSRQNSNNIQNDQGATYACVIPGRNVLPPPLTDNSPEYKLPVTVICENSPFTLDFSAPDPDAGDSVVYTFCDAYNGGAANSGAFDNPAPPPYGSVIYTTPFNSAIPLGALASIDPKTGIISGTAPTGGKYVVCVCASVFKNGVLVTVHRKDLIVEVSGCIPLTAIPNFNPITCDGFTVTFNQSSTGNPDTFFWDFGDPASGAGNNTSNLPVPTHTFSVAGIFNVKLRVSIAGQCVDSITKPISVFPGFFPGFINSAVLCVGQPVQFNDTTKTSYGVVDSWRWDFGDPPPIFSDTSHLQNPTYTYNQSGTYTVELRVTNSKGCDKTVLIPITISDPPVVDVFPGDTVYCALDSLQLTGTGTGIFNWTPNTNIIGANTATPTVFPTVATKYYATLTSLAGCSSKDSITVTPKNDLTNAFTGLSPICEEDTITLTGTSNYAPNVSWKWNPVLSIESPNSGTTRVFPRVTTNYVLTTTWGKHCVVNANKTIVVKPLAIPDAGPSKAICGNQQSTQLNASGGNTYTWSPPTGLSNPNISNPVASPVVTTIYTVSVGVTGCTKTRDDSLIVTVKELPPLTLINDTLICNIDTLQLTTTGAGNYTWSPNYMISSTNSGSPLVSPDVPTTYYVSLSDAFGCISKDTVFVDVKDHVTLFAGNDTTICQTDGFFLTTVSDALHYKWTPFTYLNYDTLKRPFAKPLSSITYQVMANIGKCQSQDEITVTVVPYPPANAGLDTAICPGFSTQLSASGGSSYLWTPATFLSDRNARNPLVINPTASIRYIVTVTDVLGCPKPVKDTVWVTVYPKVIANAGPPDTNVVLGEPLLLRASGGSSYLWSPPTWLNNPVLQTPVAMPQLDIKYLLTATSPGGCIGTDTILVHLFKLDPDMYVPTAFTPNGDSKNDFLKPTLIGMKELLYFRVYNRFGNLVFSTSDIGKGWDGTYLGKGQDPATFVWMAEGVTYKGERKVKKGYAVLIRQ
jgi:gliding motility-associated-like protein